MKKKEEATKEPKAAPKSMRLTGRRIDPNTFALCADTLELEVKA